MINKASLSAVSGFLFLFFLSCSKDSPAPVPAEVPPAVFRFDRIEVVETKLFVGSKDGGVDRSHIIDDPASYFPKIYGGGSSFDVYIKDSLQLVQDTLAEFPLETAANRFVFKVAAGDSLFRWNTNADFWQFYGFKLPDDNGVVYNRSFYRFVKVRSDGPSILLSGSETGFLTGKGFFDDGVYRFDGLEDMTAETDTVLFCNVKYYYK
ncbi:hypothetical protein BC792_12051 [Sphingobacterium allocomposti]|uniref:Lipoprotein n=1 Tax=Sphingobacterium allocomposti TaxID=415956 RepID=A0A5S5D5M3_9SPHI|nr:hypothetical protein [Sphingobacterium composti Yoo et al. 2007 non Ten et al. 2007]TYP91343.1 hypothetical protein BC792_12051 [Sphingobacterium composti Yoo et al. 2007 non Ten et al. 2007]